MFTMLFIMREKILANLIIHLSEEAAYLKNNCNTF